MPNNTKPHVIEQIADLTRKGWSLREIRAATGVHTVTIRRHQKRLGIEDVLCPCGKPINEHRGLCLHRYARAEGRQAFMSRWLSGDVPITEDLDETYLGAG